MTRVTGSVTLDGQPVDGATVAFYPDEGRRPARGITDASGNFELMTFKSGDGALLGQHRVSVTKTETAEQEAFVVDGEKIETPTGGTGERVKHLLPVRYASPSTSQLMVEVAKGMEPVTLDLSSE
jgi:hypothetical protein